MLLKIKTTKNGSLDLATEETLTEHMQGSGADDINTTYILKSSKL